SCIELPRPGDAAANPILGAHVERVADVSEPGAAPGVLARREHRPVRARLQSARRRPARPARPQAGRTRLRSGMSQSPLVVEDLTVRVESVEVVHQLRFALAAGQRTGLIGESGSGKTLTALAIMGLLAEGLSASGRVLYRDRDLLSMSERELCQVRGDRLAMVFQEPMA